MNKPVPRCFDSRRAFQLWTEASLRSQPDGSSYCTDCMAAYQRRMIAQGRCAYPSTAFCFDSDGFIEGRRLIEHRVRLREVA